MTSYLSLGSSQQTFWEKPAAAWQVLAFRVERWVFLELDPHHRLEIRIFQPVPIHIWPPFWMRSLACHWRTAFKTATRGSRKCFMQSPTWRLQNCLLSHKQSKTQRCPVTSHKPENQLGVCEPDEIQSWHLCFCKPQICCAFTFLYVTFSISVLLQLSAFALVGFRHTNHFVRFRKTSQFGCFGRHDHSWRWPKLLSLIAGFGFHE